MNRYSVILKLTILLCLITSPLVVDAQQHYKKASLKGKWKFSLGDNMEFAVPDYDDSRWEQIDVPSSWENEGFHDYDGFAWYRKTVNFDFTNEEHYYLHLGRIDDVDEVYFNGHLIGSRGAFPPNYQSAYDIQREYYVPKEYARKNKNVIAIRVYDNMGPGGIMSYRIGIYQHGQKSRNAYYINGVWKFRLSDNPKWSSPDFDDRNWDNISVPSHWDNQGFKNYDGIAWYRKTIDLPNTIDSERMMLILGKIDDADEVFINGVKIGSTGDFNYVFYGNGTEDWMKRRNYMIPDNVIKPGQRNVIAVRVYDYHDVGGIYEGPLAIIPVEEYRNFQKEIKNDYQKFMDWVEQVFD